MGSQTERPVPRKATGGCLCGAIRYTMRFPREHDFVANSCKCFCTACRKQSGALFLHLHAIPISHFSCTAPVSALGDYSCSPGCHRLFCKICGSFIAWQQDPLRERDVHNSVNVEGEKERRKERERRGSKEEGGHRSDGTRRRRVRSGEVRDGGVIGKMIECCDGVMTQEAVEQACEIDPECDVQMVDGVGIVNPSPALDSPASRSNPREAQPTAAPAPHLAAACVDPTFNQSTNPPTPSLSTTNQPDQPTFRHKWETEGEVEICVGTLDEEFLVGRRDKNREVIPGTGYGDLVAHPEGRVLWAENDIRDVTDGVSGVRWKYGKDAGVMVDAGVLISGHV